jgi:hypothetical protein
MVNKIVLLFQDHANTSDKPIRTLKFGYLHAQKPIPFVYPNIYSVQKTTGPDRLAIAPSENHVALLLELVDLLPEPFGILYVLLTPRAGSGTAGRYQSPAPSSRSELTSFIRKFKDYLELDGRHHLWIISLPTSATLVYDNHNVIYAYGPLDSFRQVIRKRGLQDGDVKIPAPHVHNYNQQFDTSEKEIMSYWDWIYFPLAENDDD